MASVCNGCGGNRIRSRVNYSHGTKSKPTVSMHCKDCGSYNVHKKKAEMKGRRRP